MIEQFIFFGLTSFLLGLKIGIYISKKRYKEHLKQAQINSGMCQVTKYDIIAVKADWLGNDLSNPCWDNLTVIKTYTDIGWRFIGYSPTPPYYAYFDRRYKLK